MKLTIGTRGSGLAMWQARHVARAIEDNHPGVSVDLLIIKTRGDKILDTPLAQIGGKGLFTKEIEDALLENKVDLAVHSLKDVPTELPGDLKLGAIMEREDPRDVFISRDGKSIEELGQSDRIGTSSLRRKAFLLNRYPALDIVPIRGNVDTRLKKIESENMSGVILAAAGIIRMGLASRVTCYVDPEFMIPAIGQGALAIETRVNDPIVDEIVTRLDHPDTAVCVAAERAFLHRMGGGCQVPMAAHCVKDGEGVWLSAAVVHPDGTAIVRGEEGGSCFDATIGTRLADSLLSRGAAEILRQVLGEDWEPGTNWEMVR